MAVGQGRTDMDGRPGAVRTGSLGYAGVLAGIGVRSRVEAGLVLGLCAAAVLVGSVTMWSAFRDGRRAGSGMTRLSLVTPATLIETDTRPYTADRAAREAEQAGAWERARELWLSVAIVPAGWSQDALTTWVERTRGAARSAIGMGRADLAVADLRNALGRLTRGVPQGEASIDHLAATLVADLAAVLQAAGDNAGAEHAAREALRLATLPPANSFHAVWRQDMARAGARSADILSALLQKDGRTLEATAMQEHAVMFSREPGAARDRDLGARLERLADLLDASGHERLATLRRQEALLVAEDDRAVPRTLLAETWLQLADAWWQAGERGEATSAVTAALRAGSAAGPAVADMIARAAVDRARIQAAAGRTADALRILQGVADARGIAVIGMTEGDAVLESLATSLTFAEREES